MMAGGGGGRPRLRRARAALYQCERGEGDVVELAETKPKASVVGHEAAGSFSTGINEAAAPGHPFH
jgi:hypothetical protein